MKITIQVVHRLKLAPRIEEAADDYIAEHVILDGIIADAVIESAEDEFRADDMHLRVVQGTDETVYHILLFIYVGQRRPLHLLDEGGGLLHELLNPHRVIKMGGTEGLHDTLLAGLCLLDYLDADSARLVGLLAYKHGAKLARDTHICKFFARKCLIFRIV